MCERPHTVPSRVGQQGRACTEIHFLISPTPTFQPHYSGEPRCLSISGSQQDPYNSCSSTQKERETVLTENPGKHYLSWRGHRRWTARLLVLVMPGCFLVSVPVSDVYDCLIASTIARCQDVPLGNTTGSSLSITAHYTHSLHFGFE